MTFQQVLNTYDIRLRDFRLCIVLCRATYIMIYSSEVWGFHQANNVERIHTQYRKRILHVKRCTQNDFVYGVLGRFHLSYNRRTRLVKYWFKIKNSDDLKYCKIMYEILKSDEELYPNKVSWVSLLEVIVIIGFL